MGFGSPYTAKITLMGMVVSLYATSTPALFTNFTSVNGDNKPALPSSPPKNFAPYVVNETLDEEVNIGFVMDT